MPRFRRINTKERRSAHRLSASEVVPHAITRLSSGQKVELINLGLNGAVLIHSTIMLAPGSCIRLRMAIPDALMVLEGHVVRCRVIGLRQAKIQYEAAIVLDEGLPLPLTEKLQPSDTEDTFSESSSLPGINPVAASLPSTAELWVLNAKEA